MECCHCYKTETPSDLPIEYLSDIDPTECTQCRNYEQTILELETLLNEQRTKYSLQLKQLKQKHNKLKQMYLDKKRFLKQSIESKLIHAERLQNTQREMNRLSDKNQQILQEKHDIERQRDKLENDKFNLHLQIVAQQKTMHELQLMQMHRNEPVQQMISITNETKPMSLHEAQRSKSATDLYSFDEFAINPIRPHSARSQQELPAIYEQAEQMSSALSPDTPTLEQPMFVHNFSMTSDDTYSEEEELTAISHKSLQRKSSSHVRTPMSYYGYMTPKASAAYPLMDGLSFNKRMSFKSSVDTPISPLSHWNQWNATSNRQLTVDSDGVDISADDDGDEKEKEPLMMHMDVEHQYKKEIEELNTMHELEKESMMIELNQLKAKLNQVSKTTDTSRVRNNSVDGMKLKIMITTDTNT